MRRLGLGSNAGNLAAKWRKNLKAELGEVGGSLIRQELDDEDVSAASPFAGLEFDRAPIRILEVRSEDLDEVVVAVDPSDGKGGDHDEWGIGAAARLKNRHVLALEDASGSYDDAEAGEKILGLAERRGARKIVCETNRGPRVLTAIRAAHLARELARLRADPNAAPRPMPELVPITAKEGKKLRAGELRTLYVDGLLHHLAQLGVADTRGGEERSLERQQREWDPDGPRRPRVDDWIDWLVHAVHYLALRDRMMPAAEAFSGFIAAQARMPAPAFGAPDRGSRDCGDCQV